MGQLSTQVFMLKNFFESALDVTSFQSLLLLTALETIGAAGGGEILFLLIIFLFPLFLKHH